MALSVIIALYICIGLMSAAGSVAISKKVFSAKAEQIFFGLFLVPIAGFYWRSLPTSGMKEYGDSKPAL